MSTEPIAFSTMSDKALNRIAVCFVSSALGNFGRILIKSVAPLEVSARRYWFRIGGMYFELISNDDGTISLYSVSEDCGAHIAIGGAYNGRPHRALYSDRSHRGA